MHAATIRPAQLMMEYTAGEQEKIAQGIASNEFSRQLEAQQIKIAPQPNPSADDFIQPQRNSASNSRVHRTAGKDRGTRKNAARGHGGRTNGSSKIQRARSQPSEAVSTRQWKTAQQLHFTDPMALEKVLQELQLSPDLREALKNNTPLNGAVSVQQLSSTLDQALQAKATTADAKVGAAEVRGLLGSLQSEQNAPLGIRDQLQVKAAGFYSLPELRQLLHRVVELGADQQTTRSLPTAIGAETPSGATATVSTANGNATGKLTSQPETAGIFMLRNLIDDHVPGALNSNLATLAHNASVDTETSVNSLTTPVPGSNSRSETLSFLGSSPNPNGVAASANHSVLSTTAPVSEPHVAGESAITHVTVNGDNSLSSTSLPAGFTPGNASEGLAAASPTAMGLLKNLEGTAEAVIRSFHFEPDSNRTLSSQSATTDPVLNKDLAGAVSEKIAATEQTSGQAADQQNTQQDMLAFARGGIPVGLSGVSSPIGHSTGNTPLTGSGSWTQVLADRVMEMQQHKQNQLTLELESKDMGRVLLHVETHDNHVRAVISAESDQVRDMLSRGAPQLRQQMESQGLVLGELMIDVQDRRGERQQLQHRANQSSKEMATGRASAATRTQWMAPGAGSDAGLTDQLINVFA